MSDRKLYIELSTEEYQNFLQSEKIIKGLIDKLEQEKSKNSGIKVELEYSIKTDKKTIYLATSHFPNWDGQKPIVDTRLQELLVSEIKNFSDKRDLLEYKINRWNKKNLFQKLFLILKGDEI